MVQRLRLMNWQKDSKTKGKGESYLRGIDFLKSILNIKNKDILCQLNDILLFETDPNLVRVNNYFAIAYCTQNESGLSVAKILELHSSKILSKKQLSPMQRQLHSRVLLSVYQSYWQLGLEKNLDTFYPSKSIFLGIRKKR